MATTESNVRDIISADTAAAIPEAQDPQSILKKLPFEISYLSVIISHLNFFKQR